MNLTIILLLILAVIIIYIYYQTDVLSNLISIFYPDNSSESYASINADDMDPNNTNSIIDQLQPNIWYDDNSSDQNVYSINGYMDENEPGNMNYMHNIAQAHGLFGRK